MKLVLTGTLFIILSFSHVQLLAQENTTVSVPDTKTELDKKSYGLIKYRMDSVLYIMLNEFKTLDRTVKQIELEQTKDLSSEDKKELNSEYKITKNRLKLLKELRKEGINLQLDLSYNRKSFAMGMACANFLRDEFDVIVFPTLNTKNKSVTFENKEKNEGQQVEPSQEIETSKPNSYVDILAESKPQFSFPIEPAWKKLPTVCNYASNGYDFNTKRTTISVVPEYLFSYTHPKLKQFYKDKDIMTAQVALTQIENDYYVNLKVKINSKDADRSYGKIEKSAVLVFELLDEEKEYARALNQVKGVYNSKDRSTIYDIFYQIDKQTINALSKKELNTIGIFWSSGFELYDVYNLDVLYNQSNCLKKQS